MKKRLRVVLPCLLLVVVLAVSAYFLGGGYRRTQEALYPRRYEEEVEASAAEFGLDPNLVYAFIRTESGFDRNALSKVGARGLMQITDETYSWIHLKLEPAVPENFALMYDAATNIRYGCYYLSACMERYGGDLETAAAAYHSGWGTVDGLLAESEYSSDGLTLRHFPYQQMNLYVSKIARNYRQYLRLYAPQK